MGGIGSGRTYHIGAAGKCERWRSIDLAELKRMGLLKPISWGQHSRHRLACRWTARQAWGDPSRRRAYASSSAMTRAALEACLSPTSSRRRCSGGIESGSNAQAVDRPCRVLYGTNSLRCRRCRRLRYASQSEARPGGPSAGLRIFGGGSAHAGTRSIAPFPAKPPRMRWTTYGRLRSLDAALQDRWLVGMMAVVGKLR